MTQIAVFHRRMADHARRLRFVSLLRDQGIGQSLHRPGDDFVAIDPSVVKAHFLEIDFDREGCPHSAAVRMTVRLMGFPTQAMNSSQASLSQESAQRHTTSFSDEDEYRVGF